MPFFQERILKIKETMTIIISFVALSQLLLFSVYQFSHLKSSMLGFRFYVWVVYLPPEENNISKYFAKYSLRCQQHQELQLLTFLELDDLKITPTFFERPKSKAWIYWLQHS